MLQHIVIVIPIYNTELYLKDCLDSIEKQTYRDWTCILVDDGSTDLSGVICDNYSKKDKRFITYHIKNSGAEEARNFGISQAYGDFITFIDSDDWIEETYLEFLASKLSAQTDIVMGQALFEYPQKSIEVLKITPDEITFQNKNKKDLILSSINRGYAKRKLHQKQGSLNTVWGKLYRLSLIKENNLRFSSLKLNEDMIFNLYAFQNSNGIKIFNTPLYHYRIRNNSAVRSFHSDYIKTYITFLNSVYEFSNIYYPNDIELEKNINSLILTALFNISKDYIYNDKNPNKNNRQNDIRELKDSAIFNNALNGKASNIKNNEVALITFTYRHNLPFLANAYFSFRKIAKKILIESGKN